MVRTVRHPPASSSGRLLASLLAVAACASALAAGIGHLVRYDNGGIWKRSNQQIVEYGLIGGEIAGALWFGGEDRLGRTFWQAIDSSALGGLANEALRHIFTRSRPSQSPDPHLARDTPFILGLMPHGIAVGVHAQL